MSAEWWTMIAGFLAVAVSIWTIHSGQTAANIQSAERFARVELKADTLWNLQYRRGVVEAVQKGLADINSPVIVKPEAKSWLDPIAPDLRDFYEKQGKFLSPSDLMFEIELRWGQEIQRLVCLPKRVFEGGCLLIALQVAKGSPTDEIKG